MSRYAGDVLIGSSKSDTALRIKNYYSDAIAAEMEGHGFLSALHMNPSAHGMVIRGISDLFDRKIEADAAGWQSFASDSAAAFAFEMLSQADIHENMAG
jgi:nucleoside phosphorylase